MNTGARVLVIVTAQISSSGKWGSGGSVSFSLDGAAASSADAVSFQPSRGGSEGHIAARFMMHENNSNSMQASTSSYVALTPGTHTFTLEYQSLGEGAASFSNRTITIIPLD